MDEWPYPYQLYALPIRMDHAHPRALMTPNSIERFMSTSERYLTGPDEPNPLPRAVHLLVQEFARAVREGPEALLSAPETMRDAQLTLSQVVTRMLDDQVGLLDDLLVELKGGTNADVLEFLATQYAAWVLASYDLKAFK